MGKFFINHPVMAMVIAILTILVGAVSATRLPVAQYPNIVPPQIQITTSFPGADARTVEQSVATPVEQQINGVDNMIYLQSFNANDGTMRLNVSFKVESNIDIDNVLVQNRVSQAQPFLPADVNALGVTVRKAVSSPLLVFSVYSPHGTYDADFLSNYVTINVNDELLRVSGVGQTQIYGAANYAMRIWVRPDALQTLGLTIGDLRSAVLRQSTVNPAGQVGGEPAPPGQEFTYTIRAQGRLSTAEEFGNIVVRENPDGSTVRMRDVSRIELGTESYTQRAAFTGKPAAVLAIFQTPGSNALVVADGAKKKMEELARRFPNDVVFVTSLDTTLPVTEGIREVLVTLVEAFGLVILVVFLFLQNWRATVIPLLTVPVSLIGTFAVFPVLGFSINTLSLFGLVLAIGLVIDDAILVVEAVERHIEDGMAPREAALKAMEEISGPIIAVALVLSAVFVPVAFIPGIAGRLYQQFALTIAISVIISAFNALSLSPALSALMLRPRKEGKKKTLAGRFFGAFNRTFDRTRDRYVAGSAVLARKLVIAIGLLVILTAGAGWLGKKTPTGFFTEEDQGYLFVNIELPAAASLQRTDEVCRELGAILDKTEGVQNYATIAGFSLLSQSTSTFSGFVFVGLKPWDERKGEALTAAGIASTLNRRFFGGIPAATIVAFPPPPIQGLGTGGGFDILIQDRSGTHTPRELELQTAKFLEAASKRPEIGRAITTFRAQVPQIFANVDRDKVLKEGIDIGDVYATLQAFMGSTYINDFNRFGRQWRVYLAGAPEYRVNAAQMSQFWVRSKNNVMVPLSSFVTIEDTAGPQFTTRFNLFSSAEVTGQPAPGYSSGQAMKALEEVAHQTLGPDFSYAWSALSYQQANQPSAAGTFALAILSVFLILAALYESWSLPFTVLLGTPIAALGAFLGLLALRMEFNVYAQIGLIMLIGLAAKNAILIVEFARSELESGKSVTDAALEGARLRLRPILMTSFAFVFGMLPLLGATGAGAVSRRILGTVVIFGMLSATLIASFITPALFVAVERLVAFLKRKKGKTEPPSEAPAPKPVTAQP
ncbi:RND efflux system, inner membrane transporter CmeB [Labilithrix luteola]|uniref:RND efflux system, inner membrane transporter CmeB n=1 Tax=Labilithrix luteola TaxID=1391654 RepID=A0A0K1QGN0_9BACT|nr:multidrug efflux RND transporter permease subunit [Labilithrix luteola]AKV04807.1 RND efflux system, inner membrane transporter CmeB [Labilithrix luteola]